MARAGTQSATTTSTTAVFTTAADGAAQVFKVQNDSASAGNALVNVPGLHGALEFDVIPPGSKEYYRIPSGNTSIVIKSNSTATAYYAVVG